MPQEQEDVPEEKPLLAAQMFGDMAPAFVGFTEELFTRLWPRPELAPRDRSLITVASLVSGGNTEQLASHLARAKRNGLTEEELVEVITHLAFYAGWPKAMSAMSVAKEVFGADGKEP
ncbi:MAG: carboxymuconolactone decarboxylase family protein [Trebonia sp.]